MSDKETLLDLQAIASSGKPIRLDEIVMPKMRLPSVSDLMGDIGAGAVPAVRLEDELAEENVRLSRKNVRLQMAVVGLTALTVILGIVSLVLRT